jgi:dCMP deaminase
LTQSIKVKYCFAHAKAARLYADELSYCVRLKVGAIIVKNDNAISFGYNGMPTGEPNVCELADGTTDPRVRHAEVNSIRKLARSHESALGAIMFSTDAPCPICAIEIYEAGIAAVIFETPYRDMAGVHQLLDKRIKVYRIDVKSRVIYEYDSFLKTEHIFKNDTLYF